MPVVKHNLTPELYILDRDLAISSTFLTDKDVDRNVKNAIKLMGSCILYLKCIRKSNVYKQYSEEQLREIFKHYPADTLPTPKFSAKLEFKYCRQCSNHYMYIAEIGKSACNEYEVRYNKTHPLVEVINWYIENIPEPLPQVKKPLDYPVRIMPIKYRQADVVKAMRKYYSDKYRATALHAFKRTSVPEWFNLTESDVFS